MNSSLDLSAPAQELAKRLELPQHPELRDAAIGTWRTRMVNEYCSSWVFEALAKQMSDSDFDEKKVDAVQEFAREERRHGALCGSVVEALGGSAKALALPRAELPLHNDASSRREAVLRNVLSVACLSETVAVALIGAERHEMPEGTLRRLLTEIWSDEVGHSRFGWALLGELAADLSVEEKQGLANYLKVAFGHLEDHELSHLPVDANPPEEGVELGLCSGRDARSLFYDTVTKVIVPGLEKLGIAAGNSWEHRVGETASKNSSHRSEIGWS